MNLQVLEEDGFIGPKRLALGLMTTSADVARTIGLQREALSREDRVRSVKTQTRLRELAELVNRLSPRFGSDILAYAWIRSEALPGFGGLTAMALLQTGRANDVLSYIDAVDDGVFA